MSGINLATAYIEVVPSMQGFRKTVAAQMGAAGADSEKTGRSIGSRFGSALGKAAKRTAQAGMIAVAGAVTAAGVSGLRAAANFDQTERVLTGLYGSAAAASDMLERLRDVSRNSPIKFDSYAKGAESLAYMGFQGKEAAQVLENLGLAITAGGGGEEHMNRATDAMLRMVNAGKVQLDTLNQLSGAGAPIFSGLAAHFNTNIANVRQMVTDGKVGIEDVMSVMQNATGDTWQQMNAAGEAAAESLSAQWKIATDNIAQNLGQLLLPVVRRLGPAVGRIGEAISDGILAYGPQVAAFAATVRDRISEAFAAAWPHVKSFGQWLAEQVYPILQDVAGFITGAVIPALQGLIGWLTDSGGAGAILSDALGAIVSAGKGVVEFLVENRTIIYGLIGVWAAYAATTKAVVAAKMLMTVWAWKSAYAYYAKAAAVKVLNKALKANPIGLAVAALAALVAGLVYAYRNSDRFRTVVQRAWEALRSGAQAVWDAVKPALDWLGTAVRKTVALVRRHWRTIVAVLGGPIGLAVALITKYWDQISSGARDLWRKAIRPAFTYIGDLISRVWAKNIKPALEGIAWVISNVLAPVITWWWKSIMAPAFSVIAAMVRTWWTRWVRPAFDAFSSFISNVVAPVITWLWKNIIKPAFQMIGSHIRAVWNNIIDPTLQHFSGFISDTLVPTIQYLWEQAKPIFERIGDAIKGAWDRVIKPAFDNLKSGIGVIVDAFRSARDSIGAVWDALKGIVRTPVNWVIEHVVNPIIRGINRLPFTPDLDEISPLASSAPLVYAGGRAGGSYARGGWTGPGEKFDVAGIVHADEFVVNKAARKSFESKYPGYLKHINRTGDMPGYASGGLVHPIPGAVPTSGFGMRWGRLHAGQDWGAPIGTPYRAAGRGVVTYAGPAGGYGNLISVAHGGGLTTRYAHSFTSGLLVRSGQMVAPGQVIGRVGNAGFSTGPHLHFETRAGGRPVNPLSMLGGASALAGLAGQGSAEVDQVGSIESLMSSIQGKAGSAPQNGFFGDGQPLKWIKDLGSEAIAWVRGGLDSAVDAASSSGLFGAAGLAYQAGKKLGLFDDGGLAYGTGLMRKNTPQPERVLTPQQTRAFEAMVDRNFGEGYGNAPVFNIEMRTDASLGDVSEELLFAMRREKSRGKYP